MNIIDGTKLDFSDVLICPKRSTLESRSEVDLRRSFTFRHSARTMHDVIPVIAANMSTVGTIAMSKELEDHSMLTALHKHVSITAIIDYLMFEGRNAFVTVGTSDTDFDKYQAIDKGCMFSSARQYPTNLMIDVANGYTEKFVNTVRKYRKEYPKTIICAGNVVTKEMTEALILAGADIVKVGIGSGSACETRRVAGIGYPQLSAVIECADAAHGLGGHVMSDGGHTNPGDVAKAFGAGADFVMLGGMLAGHDECGSAGVFYGMSSRMAMDTHNGGQASYKASEGRSIQLEPRGPVANTARDILGGLRSACTYVGSPNLKQLSKRTTFVRVNRQLNEVYSHLTVEDDFIVTATGEK